MPLGRVAGGGLDSVSWTYTGLSPSNSTWSELKGTVVWDQKIRFQDQRHYFGEWVHEASRMQGKVRAIALLKDGAWRLVDITFWEWIKGQPEPLTPKSAGFTLRNNNPDLATAGGQGQLVAIEILNEQSTASGFSALTASSPSSGVFFGYLVPRQS